MIYFFFSSRRRHTRYWRDWSSDVCSSDLVVSHAGPFTPEDAAAPPPDPAMFGMAADDDGIRTDLMLEHNMRWLTTFEPDFEAIRRAPTRLVLAAGEESEGILASRGAYTAAERLG